MKRRLRLFLLAGPVASTAALLFACGDDEPTTSFQGAVDAAAEASSDVETGTADGSPTDAGATDGRTPFDAAAETVTCSATPCVTQLVSGGSHHCALLADKTVRCWGAAYRALGVLDGGNTSESFQGTPLDMGLTGVEQLSAGNGTTCARLTNGTVTCWGNNGGAELGQEPAASDYGPHGPRPVMFEGGALDGIVDVTVGTTGIVYARRKDGSVWSWGSNYGNALGRSSENDRFLSPGRAVDLDDVRAVKVDGFAWDSQGGVGLAINEDRKLLVWGDSPWLVTYPGIVPEAVEGLENVTSVAVALDRVCVAADGRMHCWGSNGRLACLGSIDGSSKPVEIRTHGASDVREVASSAYHTCARLADGTIECCGNDSFGQLATGDADGGTDALLITEAKGFTGRAVGLGMNLYGTCALIQDGSVQCWGQNTYGGLGQGTRDNDRHPTPVTVKFD